MRRTRDRQDQDFWTIVQDLRWKLDDGSCGTIPPGDDEFDHGRGGSGRGGVWPRWSTHIIAFLLGGLTWGSLLVAPPLLPIVAMLGVASAVAFCAKTRRWH